MSARRILLVEDDPTIRKGVVDALRFAGYQALEAATFDQAVQSAVRSPCDLLLLEAPIVVNRGTTVGKRGANRFARRFPSNGQVVARSQTS